MQYELEYHVQAFQYENHAPFRILDIDGEPWFVLADVCRALDLKPNNGSYYRHGEGLDPEEKRLVARSIIESAPPSPLKGEGIRNAPVGASMLMINESGLYSLILSSKKPEARKFKKWITAEVLPSLRRIGAYRISSQNAPAFIRRFNANWERVEPGYFSVISELVIRLWGRLEQVGHVMADLARDGKELRPDVSVGKLFATWLTKHHPNVADNYGYYLHWTEQAEFPARQYPLGMLPLYIEFVDTVWIPNHSQNYFRTRDPAALPHLPKLLPMMHRAKPIARPRVAIAAR